MQLQVLSKAKRIKVIVDNILINRLPLRGHLILGHYDKLYIIHSSILPLEAQCSKLTPDNPGHISLKHPAQNYSFGKVKCEYGKGKREADLNNSFQCLWPR